ncbi:IclR family transcriptional regulator [Microbacterium aquimaris]|uniref:IclR family transcriptional regulator n=1 Tax=Microbacterium aquimaris TaxID=459816 RepID=UPI002AD577D4|nr:IclR family transcriptional regulator [Microbacterium aquimaris]MDZ8274867.1 IclR family transcriptional regulator [Microbacterium aquimaris]
MNMERHATSYQSQGLVRALRILRTLGTTDRAMGLADLSLALELPKSTLVRLLAVLEEQEFVYRTGNPPKYTVGHAVLEISETYRRQADTAEVAAPHLRELAAITGLTANIGVLEGRWVLHVCVEEPDRPLRFRSSAGSLDHTYCTGLGKLLLSRIPADRVDDHLPAEPLPSFTPHTLTTRADLETEFDRIRERGYSLDDQERDLGVICLAVPVPSDTDVNVAVSVSGPAGELSPERREQLLPVLQRVAEDLAANGRFLPSLRANGGLQQRTEDAS